MPGDRAGVQGPRLAGAFAGHRAAPHRHARSGEDDVGARGQDAARALKSAGGVPPEVTGLLEQVQADHTPVDVIVVDEKHRLPVGRPYLTAAIDVASRCVVGMTVTLEAPSATSVGLCLAHAAADQRPWLERLEVDAVWPMSGKPLELYTDNAADFKSEALRRGCEQHGIRLRYRPPGRPHYGGIVERVIGTMMQMVHELPGTTFSSTADRGGYDSSARAAVWAEKAAEDGTPATVASETAFLVDFLPVIRRTLTRTGFTIGHVQYYCDALKPWIARRGQLGKFILRRDPRDVSRIWALDPDANAYLEVPYRTLSRPPVSAWEQEAAAARLREAGRADVDETALFAMIEQMRQITDTAAATTRSSPWALASLSSSVTRASLKEGISPSPGRPVQQSSCHWCSLSQKNTVRASRRSLRITHDRLCSPPRLETVPRRLFRAGPSYQSPRIFTPRALWILT